MCCIFFHFVYLHIIRNIQKILDKSLSFLSLFPWCIQYYANMYALPTVWCNTVLIYKEKHLVAQLLRHFCDSETSAPVCRCSGLLLNKLLRSGLKFCLLLLDIFSWMNTERLSAAKHRQTEIKSSVAQTNKEK